ncbi:MAG: reverse transcriptase domain-containing protein, partial [Anaplasma sp.]|nr:reverse transcriptase domain-containing protein [Anaplasma sp.]
CNLIGDHQTCGIQGRSIQTNTHVARSVLETVGSGRVAMIQLDLEKAFDRVRHDVLLRVLSHVNVGDVILKGVTMAYNNCGTRLVINNSLSRRIEVKTSVRQGCPLSPLLFSLYLEPFCLKIAASESIRGFTLNVVEVKVSAYADDVAIFCCDEESIAETVRITNEYCDATGAAVNWGKCCGFWHGNWDSKPLSFAGIGWTNTPNTYLGVPLQHYKNSLPYWTEVLGDLRSKATTWANRDISIFTRATVCNIFLVAKLWYVLQVLACNRISIQKFHRVFATFIWKSSWERMRRDNLFRRVKSGGLGLTHLFVRKLVSRFFFLRDQNHPFLRTVIQIKLANTLPAMLVTSDCGEPLSLFGFLKEVKDAALFLQARFSLEYLGSVKKKKLSRDLVEILFPAPLYRSVYGHCPGQNVLCRVKKMCVPPTVKSFFFKLHSGTLPVKPWLREKGLFVPWSVDCFLCKTPETIEHIFIYCWDAVFLWDILQRTLKKDLVITHETIRFLPVEEGSTVPYDLFMVLGLFSLWKTRMELRHADLHIKPARIHFIDVVTQVQSVYCRTPDTAPDWAHLFEALKNMKDF